MRQISKLPCLPPRPLEGHKGLFGRVLVVGGNAEMIGAPVLAGSAALRMGAGLVQVAVPQSILPAAIAITPELIGLGLSNRGAMGRLVEAAEAADAIVIGPGMGQSREAQLRLMRLLKLGKPMVLDADALNLLAQQKRWPTLIKARAVLTPHPGEMARLGRFLSRADVPRDDEGRLEIAAEAARAFAQVVVLKGHRTVVTDGAQAYVNTTGDSTLSKAGAGDVLSGILGCLLGQEMPPFDAAVAAVYLHGRAGEIAGQKLGRRYALARDVTESLPQAIAEYEEHQR